MNTSRQYARKRKFEYPDEDAITHLDAQDDLGNDSSSQYGFANNNILTSSAPVYGENCDDPYIFLAEKSLEKGDVSNAVDCYFQALETNNNLYVLLPLGEFFLAAAVLGYEQQGYSANVDRTIRCTIAMFLLYVKEIGSTEQLQKDVNSMFELFGCEEGFRETYCQIKNQIASQNVDEIIKFYHNKGN